MAQGRGRERTRESGGLASCLSEVRAGSARSAYLFEGDAFLAGRAARELAALLVPEAQRDLNLVELDPAASPNEVAAELLTRGLLGGAGSRKVVILSEPAFLTGKEGGAEAFERAREMWAQGRKREAARRLLALVGKVGVRAEDLVAGATVKVPTKAWADLGVELTAEGEQFVSAAAAYATEREMKAHRDDTSALDAALARGLPEGHVLIVAAGKVDGRLPLVKRIAAAGRRVSLAIASEGRWGEERPLLGPWVESILEGTGKSVDAGALSALAERVGGDARSLSSEVLKLASYVGERKKITASDVEAVVTRVAEDPFYALSNAVEARDLALALAILDRNLEDGSSPILILQTLAGTLRRLIVELERGRRAVGDRRLASYDAWQDLVLPHIAKEELGERKPFGLWKKYEAAQRYGRERLLRGLGELGLADVEMKSGAEERPLIEAALWRLMDRTTGEVA
ncbi:MAG TPA: DNA polymerase III subunit delta [Anaeromyxobacteraceae bacterium]|nr:DNA polymerase III subunit delta [Anaeromyxobacteraceae bacterium]